MRIKLSVISLGGSSAAVLAVSSRQAKLYAGATATVIRAHAANGLGGLGAVNADGRGD